MTKGRLFRISSLLVIGSLLIFCNSCSKEQLPIITTSALKYTTQNSAASGGEIPIDSREGVIACGVCWSTSPNPSIENSKTTDQSQFGSFTSTITGLTAETTYYLRAYATNSSGTAYGKELSFRTTSPVSDIDGNFYNSVVIGSQLWFAENLKTTHYSNGDAISDGTGIGDLLEAVDPKYWFAYNDDFDNIPVHGRLYTWHAAVDNRNICPDGWHVPNGAEWEILIQHLGGPDLAGGKLKEKGFDHWRSPNADATNESGFSARSGGWRDMWGRYTSFGTFNYWWTTNAGNDDFDVSWTYYVNNSNNVIGHEPRYRASGEYIRCIKSSNAFNK